MPEEALGIATQNTNDSCSVIMLILLELVQFQSARFARNQYCVQEVDILEGGWEGF